MKGIQKVTELIQSHSADKTISTISPNGELHTIITGSLTPIDDETIAVADIMFQTTAQNLITSGRATILVKKFLESYLINVKVKDRHEEGELMEMFISKLACLNVTPKAVWTFYVDEIIDQSINR